MLFVCLLLNPVTRSINCCSINLFLIFPQVVLQNLLMCMVCFYSLYYIAVSLCIGLFRYAVANRPGEAVSQASHLLL